MSKDLIPYVVMCLFCLGLLALAVVAYSTAFIRASSFREAVQAKKSGWDEFVVRTGLQWETKTAIQSPERNPYFGADLADKTGRLLGAYRGYPVAVENITQEIGTLRSRRYRQRYSTQFHLTIPNPAGLAVVIKKNGGLRLDPPDAGQRLLQEARAYDRLLRLPASFGIEIKQGALVYVQAGLEQDADRLHMILDIVCDLADAAGTRSQ